jgi:hypothetical protein
MDMPTTGSSSRLQSEFISCDPFNDVVNVPGAPGAEMTGGAPPVNSRQRSPMPIGVLSCGSGFPAARIEAESLSHKKTNPSPADKAAPGIIAR